MVIIMCQKLDVLREKLYYIGLGLTLDNRQANDTETRNMVRNLIFDMWDDIEEIDTNCPDKQYITEVIRDLLRYYWNYGPREYETLPHIGGRLVTLSMIINEMTPPERKFVTCRIGGGFTRLEELYAENISGTRFSIIMGETMYNNASTIVVMIISTTTKKITGTAWTLTGEQFSFEEEIDKIVKTGKMGKLTVNPNQIKNLERYIMGEIEFHEICT